MHLFYVDDLKNYGFCLCTKRYYDFCLCTKRLKFMACYSKILNAVLELLLRNDSKNPIDIRIGTLEFLKNRKYRKIKVFKEDIYIMKLGIDIYGRFS